MHFYFAFPKYPVLLAIVQIMKNNTPNQKIISAILDDCRADLNEAQRQVERANRKLEQISGLRSIKMQIDFLYGKINDIDDCIKGVSYARLDGKRLKYPYLLEPCESRAEGYELGLFTPVETGKFCDKCKKVTSPRHLKAGVCNICRYKETSKKIDEIVSSRKCIDTKDGPVCPDCYHPVNDGEEIDG